MNWTKLGTISKRFGAGDTAFGPFNLASFPYTGFDITVDPTESVPIRSAIDIDISYNNGATYEPFLYYIWDFTGITNRDGGIDRMFRVIWDLPVMYRGTKVRGNINMNRAARFSIDFNNGSLD